MIENLKYKMNQPGSLIKSIWNNEPDPLDSIKLYKYTG